MRFLFVLPLVLAGCSNALDVPEPQVVAQPLGDWEMSWSYAQGVVGSGKRVRVTADGKLSIFDEGGTPDSTSGAPIRELQVGVAAVQTLATRWEATSLVGLPHAGDAGECSATVTVTTCAGCAEQQLTYSGADQVKPEMEPVWSWFDGALGDRALENPRTFCQWLGV